MKISKKFAPVLILLGVGALSGLAFLSSQGAATAETANAQAAPKSETHAEAAAEQNCEDREVAIDEGYALSRKETRRVCH